ncbi:MAG: metal-dependent hydrolase [Thermodesulfobacteriota bacterium]
MSPVTHLLASWVIANATRSRSRDRVWITLAGVLPDLDGLGFLVEMVTENSATPLLWYSRYHHVLCHHIGFGLALMVVTAIFSLRRRVTVLLALTAFHLHLLGDLVGSRGPDGYQWPIPFLLPFSDAWQLTWTGQWTLNAWPNFLVTGILFGITAYLAWKRGISPISLLSPRLDRAVVSKLRNRLGRPESVSDLPG